MSHTKKRQNFDVTPEQEVELERLRQLLAAPNDKEAILRAARIVNVLASEMRQGRVLLLKDERGEMTQFVLPELYPINAQEWRYLVERPHPWRRQQYVKGRKLLASTVWIEMLVNHLTPEQAAENWDLPRDAIEEILRYCESNRALLEMEAEEERRRLIQKGVRFETPDRRAHAGEPAGRPAKSRRA